jgi:aconitase A
MVQIESTPQFVSEAYAKMRTRLAILRRRVAKPLTLADKVLLSHLDDPDGADLVPGESYLLLRPDRVALQDVLGQTVMLNFMQTGKTQVDVPTTVHCDHLIQARVEGVSDLLESRQELAGELTVSGGTNAIIEYFGPGTKSISCTGKATITNMGAELGATTSIFPYDERMATYLAATGRGELAELANANREMLRADREVEQRPEDFFDRVVEIDLSKLEPHVAGPHSPDRVRPISQLAAEVANAENGFVDEIATALIGSCTNSSYEDMSRVADLAEQAGAHGVTCGIDLWVTPGSEQVRATIERDGQLDSLAKINATTLANACGPCIGQWRREKVLDGVANTIVTSYNRNFPRRNDGRSETMNFIASPEIVVALSLAGRLSFNPLTDSLVAENGERFMLEPPKPAPEVGRFYSRSGLLFSPTTRRLGYRHIRRSGVRAIAGTYPVGTVGRAGLCRIAGAVENAGQNDHRSHIARGSLAAFQGSLGEVLRQHVHGRN